MAWASEEPGFDRDPLSKCQEIVRIQDLKKLLDSKCKCQDFVDHGIYSISLRAPKTKREKVFQFTDWTLSLIAVEFAPEERSRVVSTSLTLILQKSFPIASGREGDGAYIDYALPNHQVNQLENLGTEMDS